VQLASELLGGRRVLHRQVATEKDAHELVLRGIPTEAMTRLFAGVSLSSSVLLATSGVSERSFARRKAAPRTRLPVDESERLWRFAEVPTHRFELGANSARGARIVFVEGSPLEWAAQERLEPLSVTGLPLALRNAVPQLECNGSRLGTTMRRSRRPIAFP
jgi:putative toxin-antitoxin system antitoxin component (TIGR02293 family)